MQKNGNFNATKAQRAGIIASQDLKLVGFMPCEHSKPKRQPPRNDKIRAPYMIER